MKRTLEQTNAVLAEETAHQTLIVKKFGANDDGVRNIVEAIFNRVKFLESPVKEQQASLLFKNFTEETERKGKELLEKVFASPDAVNLSEPTDEPQPPKKP